MKHCKRLAANVLSIKTDNYNLGNDLPDHIIMWYGHYPITPVTLTSFLEKQMCFGYIWTVQPIGTDSRKLFYA